MLNWSLPGDASPDVAADWLRGLIRDFSPGFHLDTSPSLYVLPDGQPALTPVEAIALERSLARLFEILGDVVPYEIGAEVVLSLLTESPDGNATAD